MTRRPSNALARLGSARLGLIYGIFGCRTQADNRARSHFICAETRLGITCQASQTSQTTAHLPPSCSQLPPTASNGLQPPTPTPPPRGVRKFALLLPPSPRACCYQAGGRGQVLALYDYPGARARASGPIMRHKMRRKGPFVNVVNFQDELFDCVLHEIRTPASECRGQIFRKGPRYTSYLVPCIARASFTPRAREQKSTKFCSSYSLGAGFEMF